MTAVDHRGLWVPTVENELHRWLAREDDPRSNNFTDDFRAVRADDYSDMPAWWETAAGGGVPLLSSAVPAVVSHHAATERSTP